MTDPWMSSPVRLSYLLGEIRLGTVSLPSLVHQAHFTELIGDPPGPGLPLEGFPDGVEVVEIPSCPVEGRLPRLTLLPGAIRYVPSQYQRFYVELRGTFDDYLARFSGKTRSTLRKKVRKYGEHVGGGTLLREYRRPEEMAEFHRLARAVSRKTYQERLLGSGLPEGDDFLRQMEDAAGRDAVRGYLLCDGDRPVSYLYGPEHGGGLLYQYVGYDPDDAAWSPGTVLLVLVLERLFTEGRFAFFDFTEGEGPHKELFATSSTFCADVFFYRRTIRNLVLLGSHSGLHVASRGGVRLLERIGLKRAIKKLIRSRS